MSETGKKVKTLQTGSEDREWYPTTAEILAAMNGDLHTLFAEKELAQGTRRFNGKELFDYHLTHNREAQKDEYTYFIRSVLDVGAGDGRVFDALSGVHNDIETGRRYGIEIAQAQADDLIARDIFIIGRDFFKTSLIDKAYGVIFSNPPFSIFAPWVQKLLAEANFGVMYLVLPVRWKQSLGEKSGLDLYDVKTIGGFDFLHADREARTRVNLIRLTHKKTKAEERCGKSSRLAYGKDDDPDSFSRWIAEHLGSFDADTPEDGEEREVKLKGEGIAELLTKSFEKDRWGLTDILKAADRRIGKRRLVMLEGHGNTAADKIVAERLKAANTP